MRNCQWSVALSLWMTESVCRWCLHFTQRSRLYNTSSTRVTAARTMPYKNTNRAGKMSCRRTLLKPPTLPLHFGFWVSQYLYSRSHMPLSFNQQTLKHEELLSDHLDSGVGCQYWDNCTVMVCQLLQYGAVRSLTEYSGLSVLRQLYCYGVSVAAVWCCQITYRVQWVSILRQLHCYGVSVAAVWCCQITYRVQWVSVLRKLHWYSVSVAVLWCCQIT
jgi:hypothetical protein